MISLYGVIEVPSRLVEAVRLALGDIDAMRRTKFVAIQRVAEFAYDCDAWTVTVECVDDSGCGFGVGGESSHGCDVFIATADRLQDCFGGAADSGSYRPRCGVHDHPAIPRCIDGGSSLVLSGRQRRVVGADRVDRRPASHHGGGSWARAAPVRAVGFCSRRRQSSEVDATVPNRDGGNAPRSPPLAELAGRFRS
jgi:hypothetical protein